MRPRGLLPRYRRHEWTAPTTTEIVDLTGDELLASSALPFIATLVETYDSSWICRQITSGQDGSERSDPDEVAGPHAQECSGFRRRDATATIE
jgi:hypothetical protein